MGNVRDWPGIKLDEKPKRKVMGKRRVCQHAWTWKLILRTSRLLQNPEPLSTLCWQQQSRPRFTFYICVNAWNWVVEVLGAVDQRETDRAPALEEQAGM